MSIKTDLLSWQVTNPSNTQDHLSQPYRLIDEVLQQTVLHQLQLSMHHIQEKKRDPNYQGKVQEYVAHTLIQLQSDICCLSSSPKYQNYLLAGDRRGNLLLIDVAKKYICSKKQLSPTQRITFITQTILNDGQTYLTISAVISNHSPIIRIVKSKHNDLKLFITCEVITTQQKNQMSKYPYECMIEDEGRLLIVKTYDGSILAFTLPELQLNQDKIKQQFAYNQTLSNISNHIKKPTIYPFQNVLIDKNHGVVSQKLFQINFEGLQKSLKYKELLSKFKNKSKPIENVSSNEPLKKDSKKESKKPQAPPTEINKEGQKQNLNNQKIIKTRQQLWNGRDISEPYIIPKYEPFVYVLYEQAEWPRKKSFEKGKTTKLASKMIYGWKNTKQIYKVDLLVNSKVNYENIPYYQQFLLTQNLLNPDQISDLQKKYKKSFSQKISKNQNPFASKALYPIISASISEPDHRYVAFGLEDGTTTIYNPHTLTLQYTTQKHSAPVTNLQFFQNGWKLISGSANGEVFIHSVFQQKAQMKKTHLFQSKEKIPIVDIKINNDLGLCFVIDSQGNVRVYDLWRNQKISRIFANNSFSIAEGKGKKWVSVGNFASTSTIYTNKDYSLLLSIGWPSIPSSSTHEVSEQIKKKTLQLQKNPWMSPQINLHVFRNFEFLLDHFDGLQTIYKKGYEKSKILNLFTNLQFTQLYDRNFDIPDFGRTVTMNQSKNATLKPNTRSVSKFNNGNSRILSKSSKSPKGVTETGSPQKQTQVDQKSNVKLTTQVLHPQKFLFERRKIESKNILNSNEKLIEAIREQHKKKERRANMLQDELNRGSGMI